MIYQMALDLEEMLRARKYPIRVQYGPERAQRQHFDPVLVFERDRDAGDSVRSMGASPDATRKRGVRELAVKATIYACSTKDGSHVGDHEYECEKLIDALLVSLYEWGAQGKVGAIPISDGKYLPASDFGPAFEQWPGVAYILRFRVPRGVYALAYTGEGRPTGNITGVQNRTDVRYEKASLAIPADVGCGS